MGCTYQCLAPDILAELCWQPGVHTTVLTAAVNEVSSTKEIRDDLHHLPEVLPTRAAFSELSVKRAPGTPLDSHPTPQPSSALSIRSGFVARVYHIATMQLSEETKVRLTMVCMVSYGHLTTSRSASPKSSTSPVSRSTSMHSAALLSYITGSNIPSVATFL